MKSVVFLLLICLISVQSQNWWVDTPSQPPRPINTNAPPPPPYWANINTGSFRPIKEIQMVADDELWGVSDFLDGFNAVENYVEKTAAQAYVSTRNMVIQEYEVLEQKLFDAIDNYGGFYNTVKAWEKVDLKTGRGLNLAIQTTAIDSKNVYIKINKLTGGKLNNAAINYAQGVAVTVFPPAAIAIETGKIVYRAYGQAHDITELIRNIQYDVQNKKWGALSIDSFKLCKILYRMV